MEQHRGGVNASNITSTYQSLMDGWMEGTKWKLQLRRGADGYRTICKDSRLSKGGDGDAGRSTVQSRLYTVPRDDIQSELDTATPVETQLEMRRDETRKSLDS
jgi:hypothetical protein